MKVTAREEAGLPGGLRTVSEFLGADHRRLDAIFHETVGLVAGGSHAEARGLFADFASGLIRHIEMEEGVLFPFFEEKTGITGGPTAVMRQEHAGIRRLLERIGSALSASDGVAFAAARDELLELLEAHNQKEERMLYPLSDRVAGGERERDDLVRKMQSL